MTLFTTIILALIEGITEFLPISSTGHLILASKWLNLPSGPNLQAFEIFIQSGAITAVIILYSDRLRRNFILWRKLIVAFFPAAIIGIVVFNQLERVLDSTSVVLASLFLGGLLFLVWDRIAVRFRPTAKDLDEISYKQALLVGLAQSLAFIPGVSRSAASIFGGLAAGLDKTVAVEFSFLLAIPTIFAASGLAVAKAAGQFERADIVWLGLGFIISLVSALVAIKFFLDFLKKHSFAAFGWYRIILAALYTLLSR